MGVPLSQRYPELQSVAGVAGRYTVRSWYGRQMRSCSRRIQPVLTRCSLNGLAVQPVERLGRHQRQYRRRSRSGLALRRGLRSLKGHVVWCLGERRLDLATRLDYAGVHYRIVDDLSTLPRTTEPVEFARQLPAFQEWMSRSVPC